MRHQVLYTTEQVEEQVTRLAADIDRANVDAYVVLTVLKGAAIFSSDLVRAMETETQLEYVTASSYTDDFAPGDRLTIGDTAGLEMHDRHVLIVEDIIDTGRTLNRLHTIVGTTNPKSVTTVTLINKTGRRESGFQPDHTGFDITDEFIYGYGLDWNQRFRDLPYIAIANP